MKIWDSVYIFIKLSTTRRDVNSHILHLAAITTDYDEENGSFQRYIFPSERISRAASNYHQIFKTDDDTFVQKQENGDFVRLNMVEPRQAFEDFFAWLGRVKTSPQDQIRLVGHNSHAFDIQVLVKYYLKIWAWVKLGFNPRM